MSASRVRAAGFIFCIFALVACAGPIKTTHDFDPDANFSGYRTFAWISADPIILPSAGNMSARYVSPVDEQRIRSAVESEMAKKGYRLAEFASADLVVSFDVGRKEKVRVQNDPGVGRVYTRPHGHGTVYSEPIIKTTTYVEGSLILEFFDQDSHKSIWVGTASKRLSEGDDPEEVINQAVAKILEPFPGRLEGQSTEP